jgi:hypothetical protein
MNMATQQGVGVGISDEIESRPAAREAAEEALHGARCGEVPGWALAFCGEQHDPEVVLEELRQVLGDVTIVGGGTYGAITSRYIGYTGYECLVCVFSDPLPADGVASVRGLNEGERGPGRRVGEQMAQWGEEGAVLLFYDSVRDSGPPPELNVASRLLEGLYEGLDGGKPELLGAGTFINQFRDGYVFDGREVVRGGAVAVRLPREWETHTAIMHGCIPVSSFHEITRAEGPVVYELDGEPALDGADPLLALYIDCAGRTSSFCGAEEEEAEIVQSLLGPEVPLLGLYSGTEIAPLMGRSRSLDYTGVLSIFCGESVHDPS